MLRLNDKFDVIYFGTITILIIKTITKLNHSNNEVSRMFKINNTIIH